MEGHGDVALLDASPWPHGLQSALCSSPDLQNESQAEYRRFSCVGVSQSQPAVTLAFPKQIYCEYLASEIEAT